MLNDWRVQGLVNIDMAAGLEMEVMLPVPFAVV